MIDPLYTKGDIEISVLDVNAMGCGICSKRSCKGCPPPKDPDFNKWINQNYKDITFAVDWTDEVNIRGRDHASHQAIKDKGEKPATDISSCFDSFSTEEQVELTCDNCKRTGNVS